MKHSPSRICGLAAVFARGVWAGIMESSSGSDMVTPSPRRKVRRGRCRLLIKVMFPVSWRYKSPDVLSLAGGWDARGVGLHATPEKSPRQNEPNGAMGTCETLIRTILTPAVCGAGRRGREVVRLKRL